MTTIEMRRAGGSTGRVYLYPRVAGTPACCARGRTAPLRARKRARKVRAYARRARTDISARFRILACHARRDARRQLRAISVRATRRGATRPFDVELTLLGGRDNAREFTHPCGLAFPADSDPRRSANRAGNRARAICIWIFIFRSLDLLDFLLLCTIYLLITYFPVIIPP